MKANKKKSNKFSLYVLLFALPQMSRSDGGLEKIYQNFEDIYQSFESGIKSIRQQFKKTLRYLDSLIKAAEDMTDDFDQDND